jgi:serine/threonine protein kinase
VDSICDQFEADYSAGREPRIEDFLSRVDPGERDDLLRELLIAEWDLHRRGGRPCEPTAYCARFPGYTPAIAAWWRRWNEGNPQPLPADAAGSPPQGALALEAGAVIDRYKLREIIGEGAFGTVWCAEQREPVRRRVALKILHPGMDSRGIISRFKAERQMLAVMDHPNIAKVLDAGSTLHGRPFFVMELVRGIPITQYCDQERLSTVDRLNLVLQVCNAIQHAHQKGIIHRDIKPSNILVTLHDGVPVPKVIDFGIAKATQQDLTETTIYTQFHQFIGTPVYMSPEQAEMSGLDIDSRSDIYSLGVLLYELLTGTTPFDIKELTRSGLDAMRKIIRERIPMRPSSRLTRDLKAAKSGDSPGPTNASKPRFLRPAIDRDLDWIVMKCLEKDRTRRYETVSALALDLKHYLENEPIVARPPTVMYLMRKAIQRNKLLFAAGVAVLSVLLVALAASLWQQTLLRHERDRADAARLAQERLHKDAVRERNAATNARKSADEQRTVANQLRVIAERSLYSAKMEQVQTAWHENDIERMRRLLEERLTTVVGTWSGITGNGSPAWRFAHCAVT